MVAPLITLHNLDCLPAMREMVDNQYSLAIVDVPYGIKQDGHRENNRSKLAISKNYHKALWDQDRPDLEYFKELFRVSENQIIWGGNHLCDLFNAQSSCWIVWDKDNSGDFADCELAYTSFETAVRKFQFTWNGMLQGDMKNKETRIHPTQKPVALYKWLLRNYATEGDTILDTHGGSMSLAIACYDYGFDLTCYELDADYYAAAVKRLDDHRSQMRLEL